MSATDEHTGEEYQAVIERLQKHGREFSGTGLPLLFVKQPDNPVDPNAVGVITSAVRPNFFQCAANAGTVLLGTVCG